MSATLNTLVTFDGTNGATPYTGSLIADADGDLFGTTLEGGSSGGGTVFEIPKTASGYGALTTVASLTSATGDYPVGGVITDAAGDLFGTAYEDGPSAQGTVFEIAKTASGYGTPTVLAAFDGTHGSEPYGGLIADAAGNLFGTTNEGGSSNDGTVFEIAKTAGGYGALTTLASFDGADGANPYDSLIADAAGNLFGTTTGGGDSGNGTVFEIAKTAGGYGALTTLASFDGTDGEDPLGSVSVDAAGNLFGTTSGGGASGEGTVFEIAKTAGGYGATTVLASFDGTNSASPFGGVIVDGAGNLFGTTTGGEDDDGTVFEIAKTTSGYGVLTTLAAFNGGNGESSLAGLIGDAAGDVFGTTVSGGSSNQGTVFELAGVMTVLPTFAVAQATQATTSEVPVAPFAGVMLGDNNAGATDTVTVALSGGGGTLADGSGFAGLLANADGTYTLSGTAAAVTAELAALQFTPAAGAPGTSSTTTFTLTALSSAGTSATTSAVSVTDSDPAVVAAAAVPVTAAVAAAVAPSFTGSPTVQATTAEAPVAPFAGVTLSDGNAGATDTLTVALSGAGGTLADGTGFAGLVANADGSYTLSGSAAGVTAELAALLFTPTAGAPGTTSTTTFTLTAASSAGTTATSTFSISDTDPALPADAITVDPDIAYGGGGQFTITGHASSTVGVKGVEFSATVDGKVQDLGAATLNPDGSFAFVDQTGTALQGFVTATLTDGLGQTLQADSHPALQGSATGRTAHLDGYDVTDGTTTYTGSTAYHADGSRTVGVATAGQTLHANFFDTFLNGGQADTRFVFDPGHGLDVIGQFRASGPGHDTIDLPASDFTSMADVLHHTQNTAGGAVIHDPVSGDTIRLAGVGKAELAHNTGDFSFHA